MDEGERQARSKAGRLLDHLPWFICNRLGIREEQVSLSASFIDDLGMDFWDVLELVMGLEDEFGVTISDDQAERIKTIGDALEVIERLKGDCPGQDAFVE